MMVRDVAHGWRSLLYVPGNNEKFLSRALDRGADALVLDLEDSVPEEQKSNARTTVAKWIGRQSAVHAAICVRINSPLRHAVADLEAVVLPGLQAIMIAKCETAEKVALIGELVGELEDERGLIPGSVALIALIETPGGLACATQIAQASPRVCALVLGSEDFANACGMLPTRETLALAKQQLVFAARRAGIAPLGLMDSVADYSSGDLEQLVKRSKNFGFSGSTCVHPKLVDHLNSGFRPTAQELDNAHRVVQAMEAAAKQGAGAASLDGKMIDAPLLERAQRIIATSTTNPC